MLVMVKTRTVAHEPESNELCSGQVDNLCDKQSALVNKGEDGLNSLLLR